MNSRELLTKFLIALATAKQPATTTVDLHLHRSFVKSNLISHRDTP